MKHRSYFFSLVPFAAVLATAIPLSPLSGKGLGASPSFVAGLQAQDTLRSQASGRLARQARQRETEEVRRRMVEARHRMVEVRRRLDGRVPETRGQETRFRRQWARTAMTGSAELGRRRGRASAVELVELVMRARERLELTEEQVARLETIRAEAVDRRAASRAAAEDLRSRIAAGQIDRGGGLEALRERLERRLEDLRALESRESIEDILTEEQMEMVRSRMRAPRREGLLRSRARGGDRGWRAQGHGGGGWRGREGAEGSGDPSEGTGR